jgi:hypothetical protein
MMLDFDGPEGDRITFSQLPPRGHKGWSVREKVLVVAAVRHGMLKFFEACELRSQPGTVFGLAADFR